MTTKMTLLLVGTHFNRPSKVLMGALPQDVEVELRREPENPYDEKAVAVYVLSASVDMGILEKNLLGDLEATGYGLRDVRGQEKWKLGHVAAEGGKPLKDARRRGGVELANNMDLLKACEREEQLPTAKLHQGMDGLTTLQVQAEAK